MGVDYCGQTVLGRVAQPSLDAPADMTGLRDFLLEHIGDSISDIEELEVQLDQFN